MRQQFIDRWGGWIVTAILLLTLCADAIGRYMTPAVTGICIYLGIGVWFVVLGPIPAKPTIKDIVSAIAVTALWPFVIYALIIDYLEVKHNEHRSTRRGR